MIEYDETEKRMVIKSVVWTCPVRHDYKPLENARSAASEQQGSLWYSTRRMTAPSNLAFCLSEMDTFEKRVSQDRRITAKSAIIIEDFRVSTMRTINGEKILMRIFDNKAKASIKQIQNLCPSCRTLL